jgi:nucleoid-associated protein YgaU
MGETKSKTGAADEQARMESAQRPVKSAKAAGQEYTVKPGDSLSKIAERFYHSTARWEKIYEANRETVKNPNYIYIGMKIIIPDDQES